MALSHGRKFLGGAGAAALMFAAPLWAQAQPATNSATPAPTPTPAPAPASNDVVGPETLRDFNLNGTVTRRAEPVATTPTPAPAPAQQPATRAPARPAATTQRAPAPVRDTAPTIQPGAAPVASAPIAVPDDLGAAVEPGFTDEAPVAAPVAAPLATPDEDGGLPWPWILAAIVVALGGLFLVRQRRQTNARYRHAFAGAAAEAPAPRPQPAPPVPQPRAPASPPPPAARAPSPQPAPAPPSAPAPAPASLGIVASSLKPKLGFELHPIRVQTDAAGGAALLFEMVVINNGSAPARDVLVEAQMFNAGPRQDEQIGQFFREPAGDGDRLPVIQPMGRIAIKLRLAIAGKDMVPVEIEGRKLFVPLVAFNSHYRWSGGEAQDSASFLVGRGDESSMKMAPFRLDQGERSWSGLGARPHSMGLLR